jgi:hypothetical protein
MGRSVKLNELYLRKVLHIVRGRTRGRVRLVPRDRFFSHFFALLGHFGLQRRRLKHAGRHRICFKPNWNFKRFWEHTRSGLRDVKQLKLVRFFLCSVLFTRRRNGRSGGRPLSLGLDFGEHVLELSSPAHETANQSVDHVILVEELAPVNGNERLNC